MVLLAITRRHATHVLTLTGSCGEANEQQKFRRLGDDGNVNLARPCVFSLVQIASRIAANCSVAEQNAVPADDDTSERKRAEESPPFTGASRLRISYSHRHRTQRHFSTVCDHASPRVHVCVCVRARMLRMCLYTVSRDNASNLSLGLERF